MPPLSPYDDPLTYLAEPPHDETDEAREARLLAEQEARRISDQIDDQINQERLAAKKGPKPVKVLLLGQSESGKSTTLKNFQLMASPKAFRAERVIWRAVIQLNVVRSIHLILDIMSEAHRQQQQRERDAAARVFPASPRALSDAAHTLPSLTDEHLRLKMRLSPLVQVEEFLVGKLSACPTGKYKRSAHFAALTNLPQDRLGAGGDGAMNRRQRVQVPKELEVNSWSGWKGRLGKLVGAEKEGDDDDDGIDWDDPDDPGRIIHMCGDDMMQLWADPLTHQLLKAQGLRLEEMSGFFLDCLHRVTALRYVPSDDEILRARIKTLGVSEHRFTLSANNILSPEWRVFDVGGHRSSRAAWIPFFDDMDAIIFLAPLSPFDQVLEEDPSVGRLEDSVLLWKSVVSNPLLARTNIVLFLNKCDILTEKLKAGVPFARFITSYGTRPNDYESVSTYMRRKFAGIFKDHSRSPRPFFCHFTSVVDTKATHHILVDVTELVMRDNLNKSSLLM